MNRFLVTLVIAAAAAQSFGAPQPAAIRTIKNLPDFPMESLRVGVNRPIFRSLQVSPISAYLVARASLVGRYAGNTKIIHAEGNGVYDKMLLEIASGYSVSGLDTTESRSPMDTLDVHLLIYEIKDGKMAVCFSHCDGARYLGYRQRGVAWIGVLKGGTWTTISQPDKRKWGGR